MSSGQTLGKENLLAKYDKIFKDYLESGIISVFTGRILRSVDSPYSPYSITGRPSLYLSHHVVIKRSSTTTKSRPVFNGNAKPDKPARRRTTCCRRDQYY